MSKNFYLIIESSFVCCYLADMFIQNFGEWPGFRGIFLTEDPHSETIRQERQLFHEEHAGQKTLNEDMVKSLQKLYPGLDETERAMISLYGIPKYSNTDHVKTFFLGTDVNSSQVKQWLIKTCNNDSLPFLFTNVGQVFKPWWVEISKLQIYNVHSAVLPYARGIYSIENIAATEDVQKFRQSVGTTVHYVDSGLDTGPIIRSKRIIDPFRFDSIWTLKGYIYMIGFKLFVDVAKDILNSGGEIPAGVISDPNLKGPNYKRKDFTVQKRKEAEKSYLLMKARSN